ncbi:MAG: hypothetical protein QOG13_2649 [Sphingomonadales bacterium]|jgi:hypothetical protein|nr:hypothetical protein [Sphingomonadales bacterium]
MSARTIDTRLANALFAEAIASSEAVEIIGEVADIVAPVPTDIRSLLDGLDFIRARYGGLWVGGKATLTEAELTFEPNALNAWVHEDGAALRLNMPLAVIDSVRTRYGFVTGIIDIEALGAIFSLRCYRSRAFAAEIEMARAAARKAG